MNRKEIFWLTGIILLVLLFQFIIFGKDGFNAEATQAINLHDTYFKIHNIFLLLFFLVIAFFGIYLVRTLRRNFKNLMANWIFIISTILMIIIFTFINKIVSQLGQPDPWSIYPPLGAMDHEPVPVENELQIVSNFIFTFQIILLLLLAYCGFKTELNYRRKK